METTPRHASPDQTRERILSAARTVYVQHGRHGTTTREIAQLAGVNEVTLFRHFGSKDRLLAEMVSRCCRREGLSELGAETGDVRADLVRVGVSLARGIESVEDLIRVHMADRELDAGSPIFEGPKRTHEALIGFMRRHVERGRLEGDPKRLARAYFGMIFAHVMGKRLWGGSTPTPEADVAQYTDIFLKGTLRHE